MNVLFATSEAVPFAKTGGLADVCGALPAEIARLGHPTCLILPAYRQVHKAGLPIEPTGVELNVQIGSKNVVGRLLRTHLPGGNVPVYLVDQPGYYDRPELYRSEGYDHVDNCERYVFFCRAVLDAIRQLRLPIDVVHAHDWQTGLIPAYLKAEYRGVPGYEQIVSLFTIHNLSYQGQFWHWDMLLTGLDWKYFNWQQMEFFGNLNLMKTGLVFADALNTVSPRYAEEIQGSELGCGLEGVLQQRRNVLSGIINGVDYSEWSPEVDAYLPERYSIATYKRGKAVCKAELQRELGLAVRPDVPMLAFVGRLADQKGLDLIAQVMRDWVREQEVQWVILGTGEPKYHELLAKFAAGQPQQIAARLEFSNPLAHRIEAAADMFLMPSRFEPCGLSQLYSLKYGTVPVVRATGGLADTIVNASDENIAAGKANGYSFQDYSAYALADALRRACDTYCQRPETWDQIVLTGLQQDWSWARSAREYVSLYEKMLSASRKLLGAT